MSTVYCWKCVQEASKAQVCGNPWWTCWSQPAENDCDKSEQGDWNIVTFHQFNSDDADFMTINA